MGGGCRADGGELDWDASPFSPFLLFKSLGHGLAAGWGREVNREWTRMTRIKEGKLAGDVVLTAGAGDGAGPFLCFLRRLLFKFFGG